MFIFRFWFRLLPAYMIWDRYQQEEVKVYRHHGSLLGAEAKWSIESDLVLPPPTMITFIYSSVYSCLRPVVHMQREHIYTVSVYAFYPFSSDISGKPMPQPPHVSGRRDPGLSEKNPGQPLAQLDWGPSKNSTSTKCYSSYPS